VNGFLSFEDEEKMEIEESIDTSVIERGILIIDDEDAILFPTTCLFEDLGIDVFTARDGEEGIKVYQENMNKIDIVVSDMMMPKVDGVKVFRILQEINPKVRVILASGFTKDEKIDKLIADGLSGFIKKPYQHDELLRLVVAILKKKAN
jgi:DNA-binding NtrC family response regulator